MKQSHILIAALFIVLILGGWLFTLTAKKEDESELLQAKYAEARDFEARELYQKAAIAYNESLDIDDTVTARMNILRNCEIYYANDPKFLDQYLKYAEDAARKYPAFPYFSIRAAKLYLDNFDYQNAYNFLKGMKKKGLNDRVADQLLYDSKYAYQIDWLTYNEALDSGFGSYAVRNENVWTYINEIGAEYNFGYFDKATAPGEKGLRYTEKLGQSSLIDENRVIQGHLSFVPEEVGYFSEDMLVIKHEGKYSYYNVLGDLQFGSYDNAGSFISGKAPVQENGSWHFIDKNGNTMGETTYDDIVLGLGGRYLQEGYFLAKVGDTYKIYTADEIPVEGFECEDVDILTADHIFAFKKAGKWGYANVSGQVVLEPKFEEARSFSNGLGAVKSGEIWGFVNEDDYMAYPYQFYDVGYFNRKSNCMVQVNKNVWQLLITQAK